MHKLQIDDAAVMRIAIQQEIARNEESRYDHRLHGLLLVTAGQSCRQVAELFGENGTTVQRWVQRFEEGGLEALREGGTAGPPAHARCLTMAQVAKRPSQEPTRFWLSCQPLGRAGALGTPAPTLQG